MQLLQTKSFSLASRVGGDPDSSKIAILMPGRLDTKDYINFASHTELLGDNGFYAVSIDPPGTWDSPGELADYNTTTYVKAINELIETLGGRPTLLVGHSRGGATAMLASKNPAVKALAVINSSYGKPSKPKPEEIIDDYIIEYRDLPPGSTRTEEKLVYNLPLSYFEDGVVHEPLQALIDFDGPKLIAHATEDEFTDYLKVQNIFSDLREPKIFLELSGTHDYRLFPNDIKAVEQKLLKLIEQIN